MSVKRPVRRFSAEHIRSQPEFQYVKSGHVSQYTRVSIDVTAYGSPQPPQAHPCPQVPSGQKPNPTTNKCVRVSAVLKTHTVDDQITMSKIRAVDDNSDEYNVKSSRCERSALPKGQSRPSTAGTINIVQQVNRKYAVISPLPRPKSSMELSSCVSDDDKARKMTMFSKSGSSRKFSDVSHGHSVHARVGKTSWYDPAFEKSKTFLHKKNDMFSKTNEYLSEARPGVRNLQLHYTGINTEYNDRVIFADLLQASIKKNALVGEDVYNMERRLYNKRTDPAKATTFWDREGIVRPPWRPKKARTVAQKKKIRKEKIKEKDDKLKIGYVPRAKSLKIPNTKDMEELRMNCRYLRIDPKYQEHLYNTGLVFYSQVQNEAAEPEVEGKSLN